MREDKVRIALIGLSVVFFFILAAFRKRITYPFCTLEKYTGKVNRGKSSYFLMLHLFMLEAPVKLTTVRRFKLTISRRSKLTTFGRRKLTT